ncbi:acid protease [Cryphonectria parasitica EP155]|uniref:Acid protease n=1 Tax=Cryphonectria parasitica (strain ATCC 38755 / EP155) TaxID=660469 RepID=A0A9P5CMS0_CRYP1|nr:acid protease [Cryphonectria parasitica EP155]KAF3764418.1 acid protease [Cryphonectria parasitica EP155]
MRTSVRLALICASLHFANAAVHFPFSKQKIGGIRSAAGSKPRSVSSSLSYHDSTYVVNVTVGTPGQPVSLQLSPSASDTWVIDERSGYCTYSEYVSTGEGEDDYDYVTVNNCLWGTFSPGNSSTYTLIDTGDDDDYYYDDGSFSGSTNEGSYAEGEYISDVLTVGGMSVSNLTMGLVNYTYGGMFTSTYIGVLGIGYNDSSYDNLPNRLQEEGLINSTAYSIWVDDETASSGNLLFGAIDTTKFDGNLTRLQSEYSYYMMMIQVIGINGSTSTSGGPIAITDDQDDDDSDSSGTYYSDEYLFTAIYSPPDTVSTLPTTIATQIWSMSGAYFHSVLEMAVISCDASSDTTTNFTLQLGGEGSLGPIITTYMSDLVIPETDVNVTALIAEYTYYDEDEDETDTTNLCLFGVQNYTASSYTLGSTLLRRTYSVFDLVNNEVAIAPVKFDATATSNIVPFTSYGATVPSSTLFCSYSECYADSGSGTGTTYGPGSEDGSSNETAGLSSVLPFGALIGMSIGIAAACLALGLAIFFIWRHRSNKKMAAKNDAESGANSGEATVFMSPAHAAPAAAPEMAQAPQAAAAAPTVDKGKAPEQAAPLPPVSEEGRTTAEAAGEGAEEHEASRAAETSAPAPHVADPGESSSSRLD